MANLIKSMFGGQSAAGSEDKEHANLIHVGDADFATEVLGSELPILVDFWAPWCMPCRMVGPIVEQLSDEYAGRVRFAKLNTDENQQTPGKYGIRGIPTLILFQGGKEIDRVVGMRPAEEFRKLLDPVAG